ncbi:MAG: YIP1 family protein [Bacillota bacterium]
MAGTEQAAAAGRMARATWRAGQRARWFAACLGRLGAAVMESARFGVWLLAAPQETFYHLKMRGSVGAALVVLMLALAVRTATIFTTAFHFSTAEPWEVNFAGEVVRIVVPFLSWVIASYGVTAILYGEGTFRHIWIASAYCLTPYVLFTLAVSLSTNLLTLGERALVDTAMAVIYGWVAVLFLISVKVIHNYEWRQAIGISALTLVAMLALWAAGAMVYGLTDQLVHFAKEVTREVLIR